MRVGANGERLWIIGAGRLGLALGAELMAKAAIETLTFTGRSQLAPSHPIFDEGGALYSSALRLPEPRPTGIVLAVPDGAVESVAADLVSVGVPPIPVLHTSGVLSSDALGLLRAAGSAAGSLHPLASISDPIAGSRTLIGAWWAIEGDPAATDLATRLVEVLKGQALAVDPSRKAMYHAAAVIASNYIVALLGVAERLLVEAGADRRNARAALSGLAAGAVENVRLSDPVAALTGPISRGDSTTIERHMAVLSPVERPLYSSLGLEALELAREQGLQPSRVQRILAALGA